MKEFKLKLGSKTYNFDESRAILRQWINEGLTDEQKSVIKGSKSATEYVNEYQKYRNRYLSGKLIQKYSKKYPHLTKAKLKELLAKRLKHNQKNFNLTKEQINIIPNNLLEHSTNDIFWLANQPLNNDSRDTLERAFDIINTTDGNLTQCNFTYTFDGGLYKSKINIKLGYFIIYRNGNGYAVEFELMQDGSFEKTIHSKNPEFEK